MAIEETKGYQILRDLLNAFNKDTETVLALFNPEAIVEYPYAKSLGISYHLTMDDYRKHLNNILGNMPDIAFTGCRFIRYKNKTAIGLNFMAKLQFQKQGHCTSKIMLSISNWKMESLVSIRNIGMCSLF